MPSAKPAYDKDGRWKYRTFSPGDWEALTKRLQAKLKPYYPKKDAVEIPEIGHPADSWASYLLTNAHHAVSFMLWTRRRLTKEQLLAEQADLSKTLHRAVKNLEEVSHDLVIHFGIDADVLGTRDKINDLLRHVLASHERVSKLPPAKKDREARHAAAQEMAVRCLRIFKDHGGEISATVDKDLDYVSDAVKVLKIIGDELGLVLDETTWRRTVAKAKADHKDLK